MPGTDRMAFESQLACRIIIVVVSERSGKKKNNHKRKKLWKANKHSPMPKTSPGNGLHAHQTRLQQTWQRATEWSNLKKKSLAGATHRWKRKEQKEGTEKGIEREAMADDKWRHVAKYWGKFELRFNSLSACSDSTLSVPAKARLWTCQIFSTIELP